MVSSFIIKTTKVKNKSPIKPFQKSTAVMNKKKQSTMLTMKKKKKIEILSELKVQVVVIIGDVVPCPECSSIS